MKDERKRVKGRKATKGISCASMMGTATVNALRKAGNYLRKHTTAQLLAQVGATIPSLTLRNPPADKRHFPVSFGGGRPCGDDVLTGLGPFYVTESGKVMLDCIGGHYQMSWGYNHPQLQTAAAEGMRLGVVWDNHANTPSLSLKLLADRLVAAAGDSGLDRVMLGVCTGSVACETALKIILLRYARNPKRVKAGKPVMVVLTGNYHGTNLTTQAMRGMWPDFVSGMETVSVEPNDERALNAAFKRYGGRVAGFWAEPVMMNREAIRVETAFLRRARALCTRADAVMVIDEIQTGFWYPGVFLFPQREIAPDIVIVGKGMTAGFHPLAGILYRHELDILEQYDSLNTNGNASLPAYVALCNLALLEREGRGLRRLQDLSFRGLCRLAADFPDLIERIHGEGFLAGIKFRKREDAIGFHEAALARGLWLRVHAYHAGHRTVLVKYPLVYTGPMIAFVLGVLRDFAAKRPWIRRG